MKQFGCSNKMYKFIMQLEEINYVNFDPEIGLSKNTCMKLF